MGPQNPAPHPPRGNPAVGKHGDQSPRGRRIARVHARWLSSHVQMPQDGVDDVGIDDHADDFERSAATRTEERVGLVDTAQQTRPTGAALLGRGLVGVGVGRRLRGPGRLRLLTCASCSAAAVRVRAVVPDEVTPSIGDFVSFGAGLRSCILVVFSTAYSSPLVGDSGDHFVVSPRVRRLHVQSAQPQLLVITHPDGARPCSLALRATHGSPVGGSKSSPTAAIGRGLASRCWTRARRGPSHRRRPRRAPERPGRVPCERLATAQHPSRTSSGTVSMWFGSSSWSGRAAHRARARCLRGGT
jgi:hypothetical protein